MTGSQLLKALLKAVILVWPECNRDGSAGPRGETLQRCRRPPKSKRHRLSHQPRLKKGDHFSGYCGWLLFWKEVAAEGDPAALHIVCKSREGSGHVDVVTRVPANSENGGSQLSCSAEFAVLLSGQRCLAVIGKPSTEAAGFLESTEVFVSIGLRKCLRIRGAYRAATFELAGIFMRALSMPLQTIQKILEIQLLWRGITSLADTGCCNALRCAAVSSEQWVKFAVTANAKLTGSPIEN
jgi:hypothetical protein